MNLEGEFSKFLISNAEMQQYEVEYQKASLEIASQTAKEAAAAAADYITTDAYMKKQEALDISKRA